MMIDEGWGHRDPVDMAPFEAMLADGPGLDHGDGEQARVAPPATRPDMEWGVDWGNGTFTTVCEEQAARYVASLDPAWRVVCRIVGGWDTA
jgi:hypothetical protein